MGMARSVDSCRWRRSIWKWRERAMAASGAVQVVAEHPQRAHAGSTLGTAANPHHAAHNQASKGGAVQGPQQACGAGKRAE